jgi:hypothetical protein
MGKGESEKGINDKNKGSQIRGQAIPGQFSGQ